MGYCTSCGQVLVTNAAFCSACGQPISDITPLPPLAPVQADEAFVSDQQLFIGKNFDYYQRKWAAADFNGTPVSWSWCGFLFGVFWMAYRKMYAYSAILIGLVLVETMFEQALKLSDTFSHLVNIGVAVFLGLMSNQLYRLHVETKIDEIHASCSSQQARIELERQGGTHFLKGFGFVVAILIGGAIIGVIIATILGIKLS